MYFPLLEAFSQEKQHCILGGSEATAAVALRAAVALKFSQAPTGLKMAVFQLPWVWDTLSLCTVQGVVEDKNKHLLRDSGQ